MRISWDKLRDDSNESSLELALWGVFECNHLSACILRTSLIKRLPELNIQPSVQIGGLTVGLCTWSGSANAGRDMSQVVAYVATTAGGKDGPSKMLATEVATSKVEDLFKPELIPLPKSHWWQGRQYREEMVKVRFTAEEALLAAQRWAERRIGITQEHEELINAVMEKIELRNQALKELNLIPIEGGIAAS